MNELEPRGFHQVVHHEDRVHVSVWQVRVQTENAPVVLGKSVVDPPQSLGNAVDIAKLIVVIPSQITFRTWEEDTQRWVNIATMGCSFTGWENTMISRRELKMTRRWWPAHEPFFFLSDFFFKRYFP